MAGYAGKVICGAAGLCVVVVWAAAPYAQNLSTYGTPGLIDMPTAEVLPDGELTATTSIMENTNRNTITFQILPRLYGSFRYSFIGGFGPNNGSSLYDRSFDLHYQFNSETEKWPAFGIGIRDIVGTGVYSSEYVVATKTLYDRFVLTAGMGWGRFAGRNSFSNPLGIFGDYFKTRPPRSATGGSYGGELTSNAWFRGDAALFAGLRYDINDRLSLLAEYSPDLYTEENTRAGFQVESPFNFGASYRFNNGVAVNGYYMYGTTLGLQLSYSLNPKHPAAPGGQGTAAPALQPIDRVALASWNLPNQPKGSKTARDVLKTRLDRQGIRLVSYDISGSTATVEIENNRFGASAEAAGRTARAMANTLPPSVKIFNVVLSRQGVPITSIKTRRRDLYELENELDGSWQSLARAAVSDAVTGLGGETLPDAYPHLGYRFGPYMTLSFFDPDQPLRYEFGAELSADYVIRPGVVLSGDLRLPIIGTLDDTTRVSNSVLPHVRSDWAEYAKQSDLRISYLTADYFWRPRHDVYAHVSAGYLEEMFGGVSAEMLWYPQGSDLAIGGEINYAKQRDFDMLFGFQDYDVVTGHASLYYDLSGGFQAQVDAGRYLAGDWGATFSLDREFNNGFKVGAFFTKTDVSAVEFGEGSFDKGIRFEIPVSWLTGKPSRNKLRQTIRPVLRDGGARLNLRNRLYDYTKEENAARMTSRWGRYFK